MKVNILGKGKVPGINRVAPIQNYEANKLLIAHIIKIRTLQVFTAEGNIQITKSNINDVFAGNVKPKTVESKVEEVVETPVVEEPTPVVEETVEEVAQPVVEETKVEEAPEVEETEVPVEETDVESFDTPSEVEVIAEKTAEETEEETTEEAVEEESTEESEERPKKKNKKKRN